jgi:tRNA (cytidine/uridine-2'-O-)-methyltransferase
MPVHVILVNPEIPPNTGNVARMCGATGTPLHLVHPLGFRTDDKTLRRAGLDYWKDVEVHHHEDFAGALAGSGSGPVLLFSARAEKLYTEAPFAPGARLVFGRETSGLPPEILAAYPQSVYRIPIWGPVRSLNLSTAAGIVVYEAYRRLGAFPWGEEREEDPAVCLKDTGGRGAFHEAGSLPGQIYVPPCGGEKKHPCADCFSCGWCSDARCASCRGHD